MGKSGGLTKAEQPRTWSYEPGTEIQKSLRIRSTWIEVVLLSWEQQMEQRKISHKQGGRRTGRGSCKVVCFGPIGGQRRLRSEATAGATFSEVRLEEEAGRIVVFGVN